MTNILSRDIVGKHLLYGYENGWQYELYVKSATTIDYRIHQGLVGGRWVKDQEVVLAQVAEGHHKISWTEPTGTSVSVTADLVARRLHGVIFFPQWVALDPGKTICFQNDHLDQMRAHRDAGPTYPIVIVAEFAEITFVEDCGPGDDEVISCAPADLPAGYADRVG